MKLDCAREDGKSHPGTKVKTKAPGNEPPGEHTGQKIYKTKGVTITAK
jgi:hypothetical protein